MRTIVLLLTAALLVAGAAFAAEYDLVATGDHSIWVITNDVKGIFEKETGTTLDLIPELAIVGKGCAKGILHARRGSPDREFGLICCELGDEVVRKDGLNVYRFADEPLAVIVNKKNPVNSLTQEQVRGIFSGKITNWKSVGGRNEPIAVITQLHCKDYGPNWKGMLPSAERFTARRVDVKAQPEMAKTVAAYPSAIGHLEMTSVRESRDEVKILGVDGRLPTAENMERGLYPFFAPLAVVTHGEAKGKVITFIDFMRQSPRVKEAMQKYGMRQVR